MACRILPAKCVRVTVINNDGTETEIGRIDEMIFEATAPPRPAVVTQIPVIISYTDDEV